MARDPKSSFKFFTASSGTASADRLSVVYAQGATTSAGNVVVSDPYVQFNEILADATRLGAQADVAGPFAQPLISGLNGQNQLMFLKVVVQNRAWAGTGLTGATFQIVGDAQPAVTFAGASTAVTGTFTAAYEVGTPVQFVSTGVLPPEITYNKTYFVVSVTSTTSCTVSEVLGGTAITFSGAGTGTHSIVQVGVSATTANADTLAKRSLKNSVALTPAVAMSVATNGTTFKFVPVLTNNRVMQLQVAATAVTGGTGAGTFEIKVAALQVGREGAMGVSF
jgi:hypothetical protein